LPDLESANPGVGGLAVGFGIGQIDVRAIAALPTTATVSSGKASDLTIAFRVMTPSMNSAFVWTLPSEWP